MITFAWAWALETAQNQAHIFQYFRKFRGNKFLHLVISTPATHGTDLSTKPQIYSDESKKGVYEWSNLASRPSSISLTSLSEQTSEFQVHWSSACICFSSSSAPSSCKERPANLSPHNESNHKAARRVALDWWWLIRMNNFFLPTFRKVLPTFQTFCPDGVHFAQTVVHFAHFQNQARKRGVLGRAGGVSCSYISPKGFSDGWVKNRGCWWFSGQNQTPSGQNETHLGNLYKKWAKVL